MFYTYVLRSKTTLKRYIGQTADVKKRLVDHNSGLSRYTKDRGPWILIHCEQCKTRSEAMKREKYLKTGKGREFLDSLGK